MNLYFYYLGEALKWFDVNKSQFLPMCITLELK